MKKRSYPRVLRREARSNPSYVGGLSPRGERLVQVSLVACDLLADPAGRLEGAGVLLGGELDLGHHEPLEIPLVEVELEFALAVRNEVAALAQTAALGERPELVKVLAVQLHLRLLSREARSALCGEQPVVCLAAKPDLAVRTECEIPLLDLIPLGPVQIGRIRHQELSLDLHTNTVDWEPTRQGGSRASGLR